MLCLHMQVSQTGHYIILISLSQQPISCVIQFVFNYKWSANFIK